MQRDWDIFCKVIDNHGDLGVCWRLARQLAMRGDRARLWVDDGAALAWMAPAGFPGVRVIDWHDPAAVTAAAAEPPPDVLIEAFGCDPAPELLARFADAAAAGGAPRPWINLEYLSAESQVERLHGLPSPVFSGPGAGLTKHFFYPGFTPATGGLLREEDLARRRAGFDRAAWLARLRIPVRAGEKLVSLFCYEPPALAAMLAQLADADAPTRLLVTPGRASAAVDACLSAATWRDRPAGRANALSITRLPRLAQVDFDHMLWACDINFVRGEDSLVRALWAGAPLVWQIYPQDDGAHHDKLDAWLDWLGAPASMRRFHRAWNGAGGASLSLADIDDSWRPAVAKARERLLARDDLVAQLQQFVAGKS